MFFPTQPLDFFAPLSFFSLFLFIFSAFIVITISGGASRVELLIGGLGLLRKVIFEILNGLCLGKIERIQNVSGETPFI